VGKTRLALQLAAAVPEEFPDGTWLASLAGVADPELVASQVKEALGVRQGGEAPVTDALLFRLRDAGLLLILDNCEHLLDACAELAGTLLHGSPGLRMLATSREPLGLPGEVAFPVPPLAIPAEPADPEAIAHAPAVRLLQALSACFHRMKAVGLGRM
jgi:predicted ATPase